VRDIDVLDNGDVVVSVSGSGNQIRTYSSGGVLDPSRTFSFRGPAGVHVLPNGEFLVTSATTFGQGQGLFRVASDGTILQTIDSSRAYGALELITLVDAAPSCGGGAGDGDVNQDGSTNGGDILLFVDIMLNGTFVPADPEFCAADVNPDDLVNQDDVAPFVQVVIGP
ncbi:MAG: hypothetical protein O7B26_11190, partial [Planctomycetota bacterium]|nr:hypothetical protein [Planctomycetota bacterium]